MSTQTVWSCGGGTQSAAIAALIVSGRLPKPDMSVMVDTEREKSETFRYLDAVIRPALATVGVELTVIRKSEYATVDLWSTKGDLLLPAYTGDGGRMSGFCSNEWKQRVVRRWLRRERQVGSCVMWLGYSTDEQRRVRMADVKWIQNSFPLIEQGMSRADCYRIVEQEGWPSPPRSACWMCPHMSNREWRDLRDSAPADFEKAIRLDEMIREEDNNAFVHRSGTPLATADLRDDTSGQMSLGCDGGNCFV